MESLALIVSFIVLGRMAFVSLCVALAIVAIHHHFVDGVLQTRGLPTDPVWWIGFVFVIVILLALSVLRILPR